MTILAPGLLLVKDEDRERVWVQCLEPGCGWLRPAANERAGRTRAAAHMSVNKHRAVAIYKTTSEVIRYEEKSQ